MKEKSSVELESQLIESENPDIERLEPIFESPHDLYSSKLINTPQLSEAIAIDDNILELLSKHSGEVFKRIEARLRNKDSYTNGTPTKKEIKDAIDLLMSLVYQNGHNTNIWNLVTLNSLLGEGMGGSMYGVGVYNQMDIKITSEINEEYHRISDLYARYGFEPLDH